MAPPGGISGRGSGFDTGSLPLLAPEEVRSVPSTPRTDSAEGPSSFSPGESVSSEKTIIVVFNPAARDGRIKAELPRLVSALERDGFRVIQVETHPDEGQRRQRIYQAAERILGEGNGNGRVYVLPYGGDGTIWDTAREMVRAAGIEYESVLTDIESQRTLEGRVVFVLAKKGTASDNAVQVGATNHPERIPNFIRHSVLLPYRPPVIDIPQADGTNRYELGGHSFSFGVGGHLFALRDRWRGAKFKNPVINRINQWLSRGIKSYLMLLPPSIFSRWGLLGVPVELKHFDRQGAELQRVVRRGGEVMVTPNRIIAGVAGVPGAWGDTKVVIMPPFIRGGFIPLTEYIVRGLITKLVGVNLVGPRSRLWTLSKARQWDAKPGERFEINIQGARKVPAIRNGDSVDPVEKFGTHTPDYTLQMAAAPDSMALRLARASALIEGQNPPMTDRELVDAYLGKQAHMRNHAGSRLTRGRLALSQWLNPQPSGGAPRILKANSSMTLVQTNFISQPRLDQLMKTRGISPERVTDLIFRAHTWYNSGGLPTLGSHGITVEGIQDFLQSPDHSGPRWVPVSQSRALAERGLQGGVPLVAGISALLGAEHLSDVLGLDPYYDRELRFGLVIYSAHAVQANVAPLWEVLSNRLLNKPYDFVRQANLRIAGETFTRYTIGQSAHLSQALGRSWTTGSLGLGLGLQQSLGQRAFRLGTLPVRAAWNMGQGLIFSRLTENLLRDLPEDSALRQHGPFLAFFLPEAGQIVAPRTTMALLRSRPMRLAGAVAASGFLADMAYGLWNRSTHGSQAGYQETLQLRASQLRRDRGDISWYSWRNLVGFFAPSIGAHLDSHRYGLGGENGYLLELREQDRLLSMEIRRGVQRDLPMVAQILGDSPAELLRERVQLSPLEEMMLEQVVTQRGRGSLSREASFQETARYLQIQFSGHQLSDRQVQHHLARIHLHQLQGSLAMLSQIPIPDNLVFQSYFDGRGCLRPGRDAELAGILAG